MWKSTGAVRRIFRPGDAAIIAVVAAIAIGAFMFTFWGNGSAGSAVVTADSGEYVLPLSENGILELDERGISLKIEVADGQARFEYSTCPDKTCVHSGWLKRNGSTAACLPAGVLLRISSRGSDEPDVVI